MDSYSTLRHFADSWGLLAMTVFYLGAILWALRPTARRSHRDAANLVFRNETQPAPELVDQDGPDAAPGKDA